MNARKYARGRRRPSRASKPVNIGRRGKPPSSACVVLILASAGIPAAVSVITL